MATSARVAGVPGAEADVAWITDPIGECLPLAVTSNADFSAAGRAAAGASSEVAVASLAVANTPANTLSTDAPVALRLREEAPSEVALSFGLPDSRFRCRYPSYCQVRLYILER